jgi:hypothetical protein
MKVSGEINQTLISIYIVFRCYHRLQCDVVTPLVTNFTKMTRCWCKYVSMQFILCLSEVLCCIYLLLVLSCTLLTSFRQFSPHKYMFYLFCLPGTIFFYNLLYKNCKQELGDMKLTIKNDHEIC